MHIHQPPESYYQYFRYLQNMCNREDSNNTDNSQYVFSDKREKTNAASIVDVLCLDVDV